MSKKEEITNSILIFKLAFIYFFSCFYVIYLKVNIFLLRISVLKNHRFFCIFMTDNLTISKNMTELAKFKWTFNSQYQIILPN